MSRFHVGDHALDVGRAGELDGRHAADVGGAGVDRVRDPALEVESGERAAAALAERLLEAGGELPGEQRRHLVGRCP